MKIILSIILLTIMTCSSGCFKAVSQNSTVNSETTKQVSSDAILLPVPKLTGSVSIEETMFKRRSVRAYSDEPLSVEEVSQLLWAAQGITESWGGRTAPSAGGLYPLEVYLAVNNVNDLDVGVYKYRPQGHELVQVKNIDVRAELAAAALDQEWVKEGAVVIVIAAVYERTTQKYGDRGIQYVHIEVGHAAQNIYLQATVLNLGAVTVGAFYDDQVKSVLRMTDNEAPLYVIPVGRKR